MRTRPASASSKGRAHTGLGPPRLAAACGCVRMGGTSLYVLTAVCAAVGTAAGLILAPELNTAVVNLFLEEFSRQLAPGVHAVLLWDDARATIVGKDLVVPAGT